MSATLAPYQPADPLKIDLSKIRDVYYWIAQFGCSAEQLRAAVAGSGDSSAVVQTTLALQRAAARPEPQTEEGDCLELFF